MTTTTLYALTSEALQIQRHINETAENLFSEEPSTVAAATVNLEQLIVNEANNRKALEAKADAWCWVIDQLRDEAKTRLEHAERLKALADDALHRAAVLQEQLVTALNRVDPDAKSWSLPEHKISSRATSSVAVDPDVILPEQYQRVKTTISPDKTALKAAIEAGQQIDGVELIRNRSWSIK